MHWHMSSMGQIPDDDADKRATQDRAEQPKNEAENAPERTNDAPVPAHFA